MGIGAEAVNIGQHFATAQRAAEVLAALAKFGFGEVLRAGGLERYLTRGAKRSEIASRPLPERVRLLLEALGPTFIKAGQILSTRADLVGPEWIAELKKLRSEVPPAPWDGNDGVKKVLEDELEGGVDAVFASIEQEALAAASMGQAHRAVLWDSDGVAGQQVIVKILRPGIREQMTSDLELMRLLARLTRSYFHDQGVDPEAVVEEFARQLERETDLRIEAKSTDRMRADFADDEYVTFPEVYTSMSTRSVLVLEEIHGTLLTDVDGASLSEEEREAIARHGADAVFRQCLVIGFFHADPHPGNIFLLEGGKLCFIDCGMTGLIDPGTVEQLAQIVHGAVTGNLDRVVRVAVRISGADTTIQDDRTFRADVWRFMDRFGGAQPGAIQLGGVLNEFFGVLRKHKLSCPADIVYLVKALSTIEGAAEEIAPDFDVVEHVRPYIERLIKDRYGVGSLKDRAEAAFVEYGDLIGEMPQEVSGLLRMARHNKLALNLDHRGLEKLTKAVEGASLNVSWSLVVASIVVGSSVLLLADSVDKDISILTWIAGAAFVVSLVMGLARLIWSRWLGV